jgi:hypothetical protein
LNTTISRYVLEDMMNSQLVYTFLVLVAKGAVEYAGGPKVATKAKD